MSEFTFNTVTTLPDVQSRMTFSSVLGTGESCMTRLMAIMQVQNPEPDSFEAQVQEFVNRTVPLNLPVDKELRLMVQMQYMLVDKAPAQAITP